MEAPAKSTIGKDRVANNHQELMHYFSDSIVNVRIHKQQEDL